MGEVWEKWATSFLFIVYRCKTHFGHQQIFLCATHLLCITQFLKTIAFQGYPTALCHDDVTNGENPHVTIFTDTGSGPFLPRLTSPHLPLMLSWTIFDPPPPLTSLCNAFQCVRTLTTGADPEGAQGAHAHPFWRQIL